MATKRSRFSRTQKSDFGEMHHNSDTYWIPGIARASSNLEMAELVRSRRDQLQPGESRTQRRIGKHQLNRFRARHSEIQGVWSGQIESARHNGTMLRR